MASQPDRRRQVEDLIREQRESWEAGQPKSVSDFVTEHPWLRSELRALVQMIRAEVAQREQAGPVDFSEYALLAPELPAALANELPAATVSLPPTTPGPRGARHPQSQRESPAMSAGSAARFHVIRSHAKGGLGEVFVASDREFNREVALKQIQNRLAGQSEARSRFVLEAEITGLLEHPGIVPVYSMGAYADGNPFYAMRFIRGESLRAAIKKFHGQQFNSDSERSVEFRKLLGRFVSVCHAVAYAHSRGVLHRDLKPDNIMLGDYGETLVVDWGLATALGTINRSPEPNGSALPCIQLRSQLEVSQPGHLIGTPTYMAPEQAAGNVAELGQAADIYSLGATLFMLLTGEYAYSGKDRTEVLAQVRAGEIRRPRELAPGVPRPLDAVCLKAMRLAPGDRYPTALTLAEEIERWLADEPVQAYPEPLAARARRWVRKHPGLVSAVSATVVLGMLSAATFAVLQGQHARELALKNLTITKQNEELTSSNATISQQKQELEVTNVNLTKAREEAVQEKEEAESVTDFLVQSFRKADPLLNGRKLAAHEMLARAQAELDEERNIKPLPKARILQAIGQSFLGLGLRAEGIEATQRARAIRVELLGDDDLATLATSLILAQGYLESGNVKLAQPLMEETLELTRSKRGDRSRQTALCLIALGNCYLAAGQPERALPLFEKASDAMTANLGPHDLNTINSHVSLAEGYRQIGNFDKTRQLLEQAISAAQSIHGNDHALTLNARNSLAVAYQSAGNFNAALTEFQAIVRLKETSLGEHHPSTILSRSNLAGSYREAGQHEQAESLAAETTEMAVAKLGEDHPLSLTCMSELASAYVRSGKRDSARQLFEKVLHLRQLTLGDDHPETLVTRGNLGVVYNSLGQYALALPLLEEVLRQQQAKLGADHPATLATSNNLATVYRVLGKLDLALPLMTETLELRRKKLGEDHPDTLVVVNNLAMINQSLGKHDQAAELFAEAHRLMRMKLGDDHSDTLGIKCNLAWSNFNLGNFDLAATLYEEALLLLRAKKTGDQRKLMNAAIAGLARTYLALKQPDKAKPLHAELAKVNRQLAPPNDPQFATELGFIGEHLVGAGEFAEAENYLQESLKILRTRIPNHWATFHYQSLLGGSLLGQNKPVEAEPLLMAGYQGLKQRENEIPPEHQKHLTAALQRLVELYKALDKTADVAKWQAELDVRILTQP